MPRWLRWSLLALVSWGLWAIIARLIGSALNGAQNQALSTLGIVPVMLALALSRKFPATGTGNQRIGILFALAAGAVSCVGNVFYYDAFSRGGQATLIVPLTALYPLATVLLAMLLLKERLNWIQTCGILVSFVAIYLFNVQHEDGLLSRWLIYALLPILLWGASGFLQKVSTQHISGQLSTLWFLAAFIPFGLLFLVSQPLPVHMTVKLWLLVVTQGFLLALGNFAILLAFASQGKASIIAPLAALYPVVSVPIAIFVLGEACGARETIGLLLALVSMAALSFETKPPDQPRIPAVLKSEHRA